ncbi:MAG: excinuclease ABC subunit C [Clostridia bacterium]|nr:excinuclease ABC subunit C [Clostridia bacterium]
MFNLEEELKKLPNKPGVYVMRDKEDNIIYVGKAISLKNRVRQYFRKTDKTARIEKMVSLIDHFEYIVVDNEAEALILECNLIKKNRPKFNVLLKDDKTYPYIKIDLENDYPGVFITRKIVKDGSKYFGPYANPGAAKEMVNFIKEKYKIRQCRNLKERSRPCLNYHIKKCLAPCMGYITKEEYRKQIDEIIDLLDGKTDKLIKELESEMQEASKKLDFEKAAYIRDKIQAIQRVSEKQKVSNISENNIDVIGIAKSELEVCIEIFFVRGSKMIGREHYFYRDLKDMEDKEILSRIYKAILFRKP